MNEPTALSATVWVKPASGRVTGEPITTANVAEIEASPEDVERAARYFGRTGLTVTDVSGSMFSISGTVQQFEKVFDVRLRVTGEGFAAGVTTEDGSHELPLSALDPTLAGLVHIVTFSEPMDFGPGAP